MAFSPSVSGFLVHSFSAQSTEEYESLVLSLIEFSAYGSETPPQGRTDAGSVPQRHRPITLQAPGPCHSPDSTTLSFTHAHSCTPTRSTAVATGHKEFYIAFRFGA